MLLFQIFYPILKYTLGIELITERYNWNKKEFYYYMQIGIYKQRDQECQTVQSKSEMMIRMYSYQKAILNSFK